MGGEATFSGTNYQAKAIAYVYVHMLAQKRLGWLDATEDRPIAVAAETGGAGDDIRIDLGSRNPPVEVQVKHGLSADSRLREALGRVVEDTAQPEDSPVVLVVDSGSSKTVWKVLAADLKKLRSGRSDGIRESTLRIAEDLDVGVADIQRVHVVRLDVDQTHEAHAKEVISLLESLLEDPNQAKAAWSVLVADANEICAERLSRTRRSLEKLLLSADLVLKPPSRDEPWHRDLDWVKKLIKEDKGRAALHLLADIESTIRDLEIGSDVKYRLAQNQAAVFLQLDRYEEAMKSVQRALDIKPTSAPSLATGATVALLLGDIDLASKYAEESIEEAPEDPSAWGVRAQVAVISGKPMPTPPISIAESSDYRAAQAQIASNLGDWDGVLELTQSLMSDGLRSSGVLILRANAFLRSMGTTANPESQRLAEQAERLCSELIESLEDELHPFSRKALFLRAGALQILDRTDDAESDLCRLREVSPDDPDAVFQSALIRYEARDPHAALSLLQNRLVDHSPLLLALRARTRFVLGDENVARDDLEAAQSLIATFHDPDMVRLTIAEVALQMKDVDCADRILGDVQGDLKDSVSFAVLRGRTAIYQGAIEEADRSFRRAAEMDPSQRNEVLFELAHHLFKGNQAADAVGVLDEVGEDQLPHEAIQLLAEALVQSNQLVRAQEIVEGVASSGDLPEWALSVAIRLAFEQEDVDAAVEHLKDLVSRGEATAQAQIELARCLIELDRPGDARAYLEEMEADPTLAPTERMQIAKLLLDSGDVEEGLDLAFRAFRVAKHDPEVNRAFILLALTSKVEPAKVTQVGMDTYVRLESENGEFREYTIYSTPPIEPLFGELSTHDAEELGLLGLNLGDDWVVDEDSSWSEQRWVVDRILPAMQFEVNDAMAHYEERFPLAPRFLRRFSFGEDPSISDLAPIIGSLQEKRNHAEEVFERYLENPMPLGLMAKALGGTIADVMNFISDDQEICRPLLVDWADKVGRGHSKSAALGARKVVLTRSALETISMLGIHDELASAFELVAPRSLHTDLRWEARETERILEDGQKAMIGTSTGFALQETEPGDARIKDRLDRIKYLLDWLESSVQLEVRPLDSIGPPESADEEARELAGDGEMDAVALAERDRYLYADDLGLRRCLSEEVSVRSFSTPALLPALVERGALGADPCDQHLLTLIKNNYAHIHPSPNVLFSLLRPTSGLTESDIAKGFRLLTGPGMTPREAAEIVARLTRRVATSAVQTVPIETVIRHGLVTMASRWPARLCSLLTFKASEIELALLPRELESVQRICVAFAGS